MTIVRRLVEKGIVESEESVFCSWGNQKFLEWAIHLKLENQRETGAINKAQNKANENKNKTFKSR